MHAIGNESDGAKSLSMLDIDFSCSTVSWLWRLSTMKFEAEHALRASDIAQFTKFQE